VRRTEAALLARLLPFLLLGTAVAVYLHWQGIDAALWHLVFHEWNRPRQLLGLTGLLGVLGLLLMFSTRGK
jgi:hypothetical protein